MIGIGEGAAGVIPLPIFWGGDRPAVPGWGFWGDAWIGIDLGSGDIEGGFDIGMPIIIPNAIGYG